MKASFTIPGRLPGYNEIKARCWQESYRKKTEAMRRVQSAVFVARPRVPRFTKPVSITFYCFEPNNRRDPDNVQSGAQKIILDALQQIKVLQGDGRKYIADIHAPRPEVDKLNPRVVVVIEEVEDGEGLL